MPTWDDIYRKYNSTGEKWASLEEGVHPLFIRFIEKTDFRIKKALDIGCGDGRYMQFLRDAGFDVFGIDSSPAAVELVTERLGSRTAEVADMYSYEIPRNEYFLIISMNTMHHGTKEQVTSLVGRVRESLIQGGRFFFTLPDIGSARKWNTFKYEQGLGDGILVPKTGPERGIKHSFFAGAEIENLMSGYRNVFLQMDDRGRWFVRGTK